jgi:hypothetical protein
MKFRRRIFLRESSDEEGVTDVEPTKYAENCEAQ